MLRIFFFLILTFLVTPDLCAEPFWGSATSQSLKTAPDKLKRGQFIWKGSAGLVGAMVAKVSISDQKIYLYRKGTLIGVSTVSTGKSKHNTPKGFFSVLGKNRFHRSKKYNNAPMPYTQWLTSKGIAMHAGNIPGYPASHGCIRLPTQFARFLYEVSFVGMPVVITNQKIVIKRTHANSWL